MEGLEAVTRFDRSQDLIERDISIDNSEVETRLKSFILTPHLIAT